MPTVFAVADRTIDGVDKESRGGWSYESAFSRNLGLISREQQAKLRSTRIAIAGLGGVGGIHLVTLARLGIGRFTIADPDAFEVANFNRQLGASLETVGRGKAEVMAELARAINPEVELTVLPERVTRRTSTVFWMAPTCWSTASTFSPSPRGVWRLPRRGAAGWSTGQSCTPQRRHRRVFSRRFRPSRCDSR